ncbi:MAG: HRDC domain-containing protein, partial [Singulisphaera sp.]
MKHELVTTDRQLEDLCRSLADAKQIAFDTEFVSEDTYRPQLCLVQVAAAGRLVVIDPLKITDMSPFWRVLAEGGHETIVHAGRQEIEFSLAAIGRVPNRLFDVQIAAGLVGLEYPASYGSLVSKLLGIIAQKGETRTDWRRRPLSDRQLEYALADVDHLAEMREKLGQRLERLKRTSWFDTEMADWLTDVQNAQNRERWRKVSGSSSLPPRGLATVREIWLWREAEAARRNCPVKRVLRDDLIVELARRRSTDPKQIRAIR